MARTAKTNVKNKDEPKPVHICGDCGWGEFYYTHSNLDMEGKPICLKCPYVQNRSMIRSERLVTNGSQKVIKVFQNVSKGAKPTTDKKVRY